MKPGVAVKYRGGRYVWPLSAAAVIAAVHLFAVHGGSYTWSGQYAPEHWVFDEANDPAAFYTFAYTFAPPQGDPNLLHIAGPSVQGPTTTMMRSVPLSAPDDNFRFDYSIGYGQATAVSAYFIVKDSGGNTKYNVFLTASGSSGPFSLSAGDRIYFVLDSTLAGMKFSPGYIDITPVPEPHHAGFAVGAGLIGYILWRRRKN
ncbi:MAG: hypothetical protein ACP5MD_12085 [Verrucomicrobiia bacterium]